MCTAITYQTGDFYFGRNLDLEYAYDEIVTITPRNYPFRFRNGYKLPNHYALIGMATVAQHYPLYYEATNEKGLCLAGLHFPKNARYYAKLQDKDNIAPFELIPWVLGQCESVKEAKELLSKLNLWNEPFSAEYPLSPLHWLLADRQEAVTIETTSDGMKLYANPVGVLTNNPPFDYHMYNLANYMNLTPLPPENRFSSQLELTPFSLGMGAIGLPGDLSSPSRFIKAAFTKLNSVCNNTESASISQFFHILGSVAQQRGLTNVRDKEYEFTLYSSCCNTDKGIYYYTTYENSQISAVDMHRVDLDGTKLLTYPLITGQQIRIQN
ncbi:MAG: choloylglycine hydrolase [Oscillospiraceae bacterium]|nr:choloylglycine hydrolase [Oscillospiraceae bacterium]